jgi:CheY-like chemotaxis protein
VSVRSEGAGKGAEFVVHLPLEQPRPGTAATKPARTASPAARRILVIEDNADAAEALGMMLQMDGHEVEIARDGLEGLRIARELRPDIVLCDLGLPGINGYEVAHALKTDAGLRSTRLVALSGYAAPEDVTRALSSGFDHHLAKPIAVERLRRMIADAP